MRSKGRPNRAGKPWKEQCWRSRRGGKVPKLPDELVKPKIVTGLQGLGRGNDRNKLIGNETRETKVFQNYLQYLHRKKS